MTEDYVADVRDTFPNTFYTGERNNMNPSHIREKEQENPRIFVFFVQFCYMYPILKTRKIINSNASIT